MRATFQNHPALRFLATDPHLFLALALLAVHTAYFFGWSIDDPYISYRYARNLADGQGLVFNEGERVEGYSNFTFVLLLAGAAKIGADLPDFARATGFLCALGVMLVVWIAMRRTEIVGGAPSLVRRAGLYLLALSGPFALWAVSGLETSFYTLLGAMSLWLCAREMEGAGRFPWSALLCALAALSRPEGAIVFLVCLVAKTLWLVRRRGKETWARVALWAGGFAVLFGAYLAWRAWYYGGLLPLPYYAKATGALQERLVEGGKYLGRAILFSTGPFGLLAQRRLGEMFPASGEILAAGPLALFALCFGVVAAARAVRPRTEQSRAVGDRGGGATPDSGENPPPEGLRAALGVLSIGFCAAQALFILLVGGDWMPLGRFLAPAAPALAWLTRDALAWLTRDTRVRLWGVSQGRSQRLVRSALALAVLACVASSLAIERKQTFALVYSLRTGSFHQPYIAAGRWIGAYADAADWIALDEAGIIPFYSGLKTIDMLGLMEPRIARLEGGLHKKFDSRYVLAREPRFIFLQCVSLDPLDGYYGADDDMLAQPEFRERYAIRKTWTRGNEIMGRNPMVLFERVSTPKELNVNRYYVSRG